MNNVTVVIVPGLRDHVPDHWQTHLAAELPLCVTVPPLGRLELDCAKRVDTLEREIDRIAGKIVLVAHSGGAITVAHWAMQTRRTIHGALLAAPADLETQLPDGYPKLLDLRAAGWLPIPRERLPFKSIVAASRNDPLASYSRIVELAEDWGSQIEDLGRVGHLNPASGYGPWPQATSLINRLSQ